MSKLQLHDGSGLKALSDPISERSVLWTQMVQKVLCLLPESERPNIAEAEDEFKEALRESLKGNGEFNGCRLPPPFSPKFAKFVYDNWIPERGDVLIITAGKTGTTWMNAIVGNLLYRGDEEMLKIFSSLNPNFTYLEGALPSMHEAYKRLPLKNRIYITHMLSDCVNVKLLKQSGCKIIYVLRNPKDQLVSWYKYRLTLPFFVKGKMKELHPEDWSEFFETHVTGQQLMYTKQGEWYPHHILSWYSHRNENHMKFVYYEDLKKNPFAVISDIAKFLELDRSDEEIIEVVKATSFQSMHRNMKKMGLGDLTRKGVVGDWKNYFTVAQSELMDEKFRNILKGTDIRFTTE